jgi:hypothetical protein
MTPLRDRVDRALLTVAGAAQAGPKSGLLLPVELRNSSLREHQTARSLRFRECNGQLPKRRFDSP